MIVALSEKYEMEDVFLNEEHGHLALNSQDEDWGAVGEVGEVSFLPAPQDSNNETEVLAVEMDIAAPLNILKYILGEKLGADLSHCQLWLQDMLQVGCTEIFNKLSKSEISVNLNSCLFPQLNEESTLAEQCVQGEGFVQVNLELKSVQNEDRINIVDVVKPQIDTSVEQVYLDCDMTAGEIAYEGVIGSAERHLGEKVNFEDELTKMASNNKIPQKTLKQVTPNVTQASPSTKIQVAPATISTIGVCKNLQQNPSTSNENITRWVMDSAFRKEQERLKIPFGKALCQVIF